jgi:hypothetical protein
MGVEIGGAWGFVVANLDKSPEQRIIKHDITHDITRNLT